MIEPTTEAVADALDRAAVRYLDVVKAALLDEHYLDNEVRIEYLATLPAGMPPDLSALRDPPRDLPVRFDRIVQARRTVRRTSPATSRIFRTQTWAACSSITSR